MSKLIIEGLLPDDQIRWKKIPCKCHKTEIEHMHPIINCIHCKCQDQEDSMPRKPFDISFSVLVESTGKYKTVKKTITKIKINRGKKYQDILGWYNMEDN